MPYTVFVDDNFHYADPEERYELGTFQDCVSATMACMRIVDQFLTHNYEPGMSWRALYQSWLDFGEDPFVVSESKDCSFSARDYARFRSRQICGQA